MQANKAILIILTVTTQSSTQFDFFQSPVKTFNERQCKDNLISLTSRNNERNKPKPKQRQDSRHSPDRNAAATRATTKSEHSFSSQSARKASVESFNLKAEYDEESEEEEDDHRERFKSERSNIITLTPAKNRDIPDTLGKFGDFIMCIFLKTYQSM